MKGRGIMALFSPSAQGKASQELGEAGEKYCRALLVRHGLVEIERVHTPWKVVFKISHGQRVPGAAWPVEKVSGDFIAMNPANGKKVLVEAKSTEAEDRIIYSRLDDHQVRALDATVKYGGESYLFVWIRGSGFLLSWPVPGFIAGKSLALVPPGNLVIGGARAKKEKGSPE